MTTDTDRLSTAPTEPTQALAKDDYDAFLDAVIQRNVVRDGSPWQFVANHLLVAPTTQSTEIAFRFAADPYASVRLWPQDIITATSTIASDVVDAPGGQPTLREIATEILTHDLTRRAASDECPVPNAAEINQSPTHL